MVALLRTGVKGIPSGILDPRGLLIGNRQQVPFTSAVPFASLWVRLRRSDNDSRSGYISLSPDFSIG